MKLLQALESRAFSKNISVGLESKPNEMFLLKSSRLIEMCRRSSLQKKVAPRGKPIYICKM